MTTMTRFKPLLAHTIEDTSKIQYPARISCKLDGIRTIVIDGVAMSRSLKPIPNAHVQACIGKAEYNDLDGELVVGDPFAPDCYRVTSSGLMSKDGTPDFTFHVFDRIDMPGHPFDSRFNSLHEMPFVKVVPHITVHDAAGLLEIEEELLARGAEGVMVRSPAGAYKFGRSTVRDGILGKLKRMSSDEARIIQVVELQHNQNEATKDELGHTKRSSHQENKVAGGTMGALVVSDIKTGCVFNIGTGFTAEDRAMFWEQREDMVGRVVTYNHFSVGNYAKPRFPSFKSFRSEIDL